MSGIRVVTEMMDLAARTAPKALGEDFVVVSILEGDDVRRLGERMIEYGRQHNRANFDRDGDNVLRSEAVVLIGLQNARVANLNCGACGSEKCILPNTYEGEFKGPNCALRFLDMGIALGSAVKMAGLFNVDNRIMYRAGMVARLMGLIEADFVMGVPLAASGKSIYFDRQAKKAEPAPAGAPR
jgi:uncharacterized ferredoxin-like protein